jgi:molybdenum cofactor biosynthesis enzyme
MWIKQNHGASMVNVPSKSNTIRFISAATILSLSSALLIAQFSTTSYQFHHRYGFLPR